MLSQALMFAIALLVELCGVGYTIALTRGRDNWAIVLSLASSILNWVVLFYIVYDTHLAIAAIAGETIGTVTALRLSKIKLGKIGG